MDALPAPLCAPLSIHDGPRNMVLNGAAAERWKSLNRSSTFLAPAGLSAAPRVLPLGSLPAPKRERSKLWELNESVHCSVIGTCLTTRELRRAMGKVVQTDVSVFTDHDLHAQAVGLCNGANAAAKILQKTLDRRHEAIIKRFSRLQGETAVLAAWAEARKEGDIPGAYWAVLTHPDTGHTGLRQAFGDVHMLSHLVGAANRADIKRLTALEEENAALRAKVERQQLHLHEAISSRDATIRQLSGLAAGQISAGSEKTNDEALAGLRHLVSELQARLERDAGRYERLERRAAEAQAAAQHWQQRCKSAEAEAATLHQELAALEQQPDAPDTSSAPLWLPAENILYVGGRPGCVDRLRTLLVASGGVLLAHDGGREDHPSLLPGLISQADRVAFPVDCVSHDAALAVKRICRQLGKAWVPLRSSGLASFLAAFAAQPTQEVSP